MNKKDYIHIATNIKLTTYIDNPFDICKKQLITNLSSYFKADNSLFDKAEFVNACYPQEG